MEIAAVNPITVALALGSAGFGLSAVLGAIHAPLVVRSSSRRLLVLTVLAPAVVQIGLASYLWYWGFLGIRLWAV
jgi:hypothetical protein